MSKEVIFMVLIIGILMVSVVQSIEFNNLKIKMSSASISNSVTASNSGSGDPSYDQMMQEMHPDQSGQPSSGVPSQVGGC